MDLRQDLGRVGGGGETKGELNEGGTGTVPVQILTDRKVNIQIIKGPGPSGKRTRLGLPREKKDRRHFAQAKQKVQGKKGGIWGRGSLVPSSHAMWDTCDRKK